MKSGKNNVKTFKNILNNFDTVLIHYYSTGEQQKHILAKTEKPGGVVSDEIFFCYEIFF